MVYSILLYTMIDNDSIVVHILFTQKNIFIIITLFIDSLPDHKLLLLHNLFNIFECL